MFSRAGFNVDLEKLTAAQLLNLLLAIDGSGSQLDADLLDGQHGAFYTGYTDTAIATHLAALDPHPQYLTIAEGNAAYAPLSHNHDSVYSPLGHDHDLDYSPLGHNHDSAYAALGHNHDATYSPLGHTHAYGNLTGIPATFPPSAHTHTEAEITDLALTLNDLTDVTITTPASTHFLQYDGSAWINSTITINEIQNPTANKSFIMGNSQLKFSYTQPQTADGAFEIEATGSFTGDLLHVHQHTGNPAAVDLVHLEATGANVLPLRIVSAGAVAVNVTGQIQVNPVAAATAPFVIGANGTNILVSGLNADQLDGQHGAYYTGYADTAVANHAAAADPHPVYLTAAEGNALYAAVGHLHTGTYSPVGHSHLQVDITDLSANETVDHSTVSISGGTSLTGGGSITASRTITLVNDSASPGNSFYYGTNASGTKGFFAIPGAGNLDSLSDVVITTAANGHHLQYNGTNWVNSANLSMVAGNIVYSGTTGGATTVYSIDGSVTVGSGVTVGYYFIRAPVSTQAASFTLPFIVYFSATNGTKGSGSTITTTYGFAAANTLGATNYGFHSNIAAATNNWNVYAIGTAKNYFAGNVLIGTTTDDGYKLRVNGTGRFDSTLTVIGQVYSLKDNPTNYNDAHIQAQSNAGDVLISWHAGGASAVYLRHIRGGNILRLQGSDHSYAAFSAATYYAGTAMTCYLDGATTALKLDTNGGMYINGGNFWIMGDSTDFLTYNRGGNIWAFQVANSNVFIVSTSGMYPGPDNTYACGVPTNRWTVIYAVNGTIQTSDEREKHAITTVEDVGYIFDLVDSVRFKWNAGNIADIGFIAQKLFPFLPEAVEVGSEKTPWGIKSGRIEAVLWAEVKMHRARLAKLEAQLRSLNGPAN